MTSADGWMKDHIRQVISAFYYLKLDWAQAHKYLNEQEIEKCYEIAERLKADRIEMGILINKAQHREMG